MKLFLSAREYDALSDFIQSNIDDSYAMRKRTERLRPTTTTTTTTDTVIDSDQNAAAFRAATRVYLATSLAHKVVESLLAALRARRKPAGDAAARVGLGIPRHRLALSVSTLLFLHRVLYRLFTRLRLQLLHEKVKDIKARYPAIYAALTSRYAPAIGASLSGLALGIYPASQLRITITIYALVRAVECTYKALDSAGYLKKKPRWLGSWTLFALAQGQLLHAFVYDRDCFPSDYATLIMNNTHEYLQRKPVEMSEKVVWPEKDQIVNAIAEMSRLGWPPFVSPILHPQRTSTLPPGVDPIITPITSRAHPSIQYLSCALLHPSDVSCFVPYLRQVLLSFPTLVRFFTMYYGAFSLLGIRKLFSNPGPFLNNLARKILTTSVALCGAISTSWASICLFNNILPKKLFPRFRFFLGGLLGGTFAIVDQSPTGHSNALYATRTSIDSLWKVGRKHGWWKGVKGGSVWLFVASLIAMNIAYDSYGPKNQSDGILKILRGEIEIGLRDQPETNKTKPE